MDEQTMARAFAELGAATLGECGAFALPPRVKAAWPGATLAAPAFPVRCTAGDNLGIHVGVATAPAGSALVVDVGEVAERGYWGEVLTTAALARGLTGLVIDGGVRDVAALARLAFPAFSSTVALRGATKRERGTAGLTTVVAGIRVALGDWVVADADGVVIVPGDALEEVLSAGRARADAEDRYFGSLRGGETTVDLLGLDASLVERPDERDAG
jgi:4-hydroxy-4-methyl-2-oxoglutarate aldolase